MGCAGRSLEANEASPVEASAHYRQAVLSVILGVAAWLVSLAGVGLIALGAGENLNEPLMVFGVLVILPSPLPALLGVGQGAAAIRARGDHMILATIGLILSGLHTGIVLGFFTMAMLQNN